MLLVKINNMTIIITFKSFSHSNNNNNNYNAIQICTKIPLQYACGTRFWDTRCVLLIYPHLWFLSELYPSLDMKLSWFLCEPYLTEPKSYLTLIYMYAWLSNNNHKLNQQQNIFSKIHTQTGPNDTISMSSRSLS